MARPLTLRDERDRRSILDLIGSLNLSKVWEVVIRPRKTKRSLDQNALYHMWAETIANETGNDHDAVHEFLKSKFLPAQFVTIGGEGRETRRSTTALNTAEFTTFLDRINAWASSDLGILLPHPDDRGRDAA